VNLAWSDLLAALANLLVLEGLLPLLNPAATKSVMAQLSQMGARELRVAGVVSVIAGLLLLFFVRS
jgi:uncharacterized protein YjeT (DUF2065 family)